MRWKLNKYIFATISINVFVIITKYLNTLILKVHVFCLKKKRIQSINPSSILLPNRVFVLPGFTKPVIRVYILDLT